MKTKYIIGTVGGLIVVAVALLITSVVTKQVYASSGVIRFPLYQSTPTMDAARDMIYALGWQLKSEGGDGNQVTFRTTDRDGKAVTFRFAYRIVGSKVLVSAEEKSQYSVREITQELARRIGIRTDGSPLPEFARKAVRP
jgi:hypothetical protein